jgi:hypothetical protein
MPASSREPQTQTVHRAAAGSSGRADGSSGAAAGAGSSAVRGPAPAPAASAGAQLGCCPRVVQIVGRQPGRENGDICGEYAFVGMRSGRATYLKPGTTTAIRYWAPSRRWLIDRDGVREGDICVAYADDTVGSEHPAHVEFVWKVWDSTAQSHVEDGGLLALDAPSTVSLVGRALCRENGGGCGTGVNGEYLLCGAHGGRAMYRHCGGGAVLRFHAPEGRWLLSSPEMVGACCTAFAVPGSSRAGFGGLEWHFWESRKGVFQLDLNVHVLAAPPRVHVIGRCLGRANAQINGTYHLAGLHECRPVYIQPGTQKVIRYIESTERWIIDCEGLQEPSLLSRLYHWVLNGDAGAAEEKCTAFAQAKGAGHPGYCALEWEVWEARSGCHVPDPSVRATTAPLAVRLCGRDPAQENGDIAGDYSLVGTHQGRPAYQRANVGTAGGMRTALRWQRGHWVVDWEGLRDCDSVVAYAAPPNPAAAAAASQDAEHPVGPGLLWYVYEACRGLHMADRQISVVVPPDAPQELRQPGSSTRKRAASPGVHPQASVATVFAATDEWAKRRRLGATAPPAATTAAPTATRRWLPRLFGNGGA